MSYAEQLLQNETHNTLELAWTRRGIGVDRSFLTHLPTDKVYYVPGGYDVHPSLYRQTNQMSQLNSQWPEATITEAIIIRHLVDTRHPILAICRGHQLVHAATGGDLVQDLRLLGPAIPAEHYKMTTVPLRYGSLDDLIPYLVRAKYGPNILLNHTHHQAVIEVGNGFNAVATTPDGVVEAAEHIDKPILTMQLHPEYDDHPWSSWFIPAVLGYLQSFLPGGVA